MARIRTIKPEFWTDEKIVELSPLARLLFIGLWNFADDEGRMVHSATRIKLQILPADTAEISALLGEIRGKKLIDVYVIGETEYLQVVNFGLHQKIDKRTRSKYPPNPDTPPESPRIPTTDQGRDQGKEGIKEKEKTGKTGANAPVEVEDLSAKVFSQGVEILTGSGESERNARGYLGKLRKDHGDEAVLHALQRVVATGASDPKAFLAGVLRPKGSVLAL